MPARLMPRLMFKPSVGERAVAQAAVRRMHSHSRSRLRVITFGISNPGKNRDFFRFLSSLRKRVFLAQTRPQPGQNVLTLLAQPSVTISSMSKELEKKVALITGGTTGIGRDTAVLFAKAGAKVVFSGRREVEGNETLNLVRAAGGDGHFIKSDVSKSADVESLVQKTIEKYGRLDVAVNNAGIEGVWAPLVEQTEENWDQVQNINLKGVWLSMKYEILQMLKQGGGGAIVNMSSVAGLIGAAGAGVYVASKHGVLGLTKSA